MSFFSLLKLNQIEYPRQDKLPKPIANAKAEREPMQFPAQKLNVPPAKRTYISAQSLTTGEQTLKTYPTKRLLPPQVLWSAGLFNSTKFTHTT